VTVGLCLSWGFNNVAIKLAIHDIPPLIQSATRSVIAAILVGAWTQARGIPLFKRDGSLRGGILAGVLFALEFLLIYRGLLWTTVTRATLFLYLAPFLSSSDRAGWCRAIVFLLRNGPAWCCPSPASQLLSACRRLQSIRARCSAISC
jgi:hypothetical protein